MLVRKVLRRAIIELSAAIVTEYDARKHTDISATRRSALVLAKFLDDSKGFAVNDGGVSILENLPIVFGKVYSCLVLKGLPRRTKINGISNILLALKHICYAGLHPPSGNRGAIAGSLSSAYPMLRWRGHFVIRQNICNLRGTIALDTEVEYSSYHIRGRLVYTETSFMET